MLELFLFVNPIGSQCLDAEKVLLKLVSELNVSVKIKFVPFVSLPVINKYMVINDLNQGDLRLRNHLTQAAYSAALDYRAASFQGNKKSRQFMINLQTLINTDNTGYTASTVLRALQQAHLDIDCFKEDRKDPVLKQCCQEDEALTTEMKIIDAPSMVVYNYKSLRRQNGVRIDNCDSYDLLKQVFGDLIHERPLGKYVLKDNTNATTLTKLHVL